MSKADLKLDWCSHAAAKYAVEHWHYSKRMPKSKLAKIGVWEDSRFVGAVVFGVGATSGLVNPYGLHKTQGCELVRIALTVHRTPVTRIVAVAVRLLHQEMAGLRVIVSFADPEQGHLGTIYQAGGWIYLGVTQSALEYIVRGKRWHGRAFRASKPSHLTTKQAAYALDPHYREVAGSIKHRYLMPLDAEMRARILPLAKPYPKRAGSADSGTSGFQPEGGGVSPTSALQLSRRANG